MIFVTGPKYSGKEKCICEMLDITHEEFLEKGIRDVEEMVRDETVDIEALAGELGRKEIVIASEIGAGVIPMDPKEDRFRQRAGRLSQLLAQKADKVIRVICRIPCVLKE